MSTTNTNDSSEQLQILRRQYYSLYPIFRLDLPPSRILLENQSYLISHILDDTHLSRYAPEAGYQKSFWRKVVARLENGLSDLMEVEVDERFYELMAELMVSPSTSASTSGSTPGSSYRTFIYDNNGERRITLIEELAAIQAGTTGLRTWTAALHLAHHILNNPSLLRPAGRFPPILELGSGTGFLSILLAELGADVVASDLGDAEEEEDGDRRTPLARLQANVLLNPMIRPPRVVSLDWMDATEEIRPDPWPALLDEERTLLAADIIYDPDLVPPIISTLSVFLQNSNSSALIAATVRNESTLKLFIDTCKIQGLSIETLNVEPMSDEKPTFWDSALEGRSEVRIMRISMIK